MDKLYNAKTETCDAGHSLNNAFIYSGWRVCVECKAPTTTEEMPDETAVAPKRRRKTT